jgi:hypothetical protein
VNRVHLEEVNSTPSHLGLGVGQVCCQVETSSISENILNPELACCIEYCYSTSTMRTTDWAPAPVPRERLLISSTKPHIVSHRVLSKLTSNPPSTKTTRGHEGFACCSIRAASTIVGSIWVFSNVIRDHQQKEPQHGVSRFLPLQDISPRNSGLALC